MLSAELHYDGYGVIVNVGESGNAAMELIIDVD
jgi:hypothetical protein